MNTHRLKFNGFLSCSFIFLFHTFIILHFLKILIRACRNIAFFSQCSPWAWSRGDCTAFHGQYGDLELDIQLINRMVVTHLPESLS